MGEWTYIRVHDWEFKNIYVHASRVTQWKKEEKYLLLKNRMTKKQAHDRGCDILILINARLLHITLLRLHRSEYFGGTKKHTNNKIYARKMTLTFIVYIKD